MIASRVIFSIIHKSQQVGSFSFSVCGVVTAGRILCHVGSRLHHISSRLCCVGIQAWREVQELQHFTSATICTYHLLCLHHLGGEQEGQEEFRSCTLLHLRCQFLQCYSHFRAHSCRRQRHPPYPPAPPTSAALPSVGAVVIVFILMTDKFLGSFVQLHVHGLV